MNFVVLSSSRGTVFEATLQAIKKKTLHAKCLGLIADKDDRGCVDIATKFGVPVIIVKKMDGQDREAYDKRIDAAVRELGLKEGTGVLTCMGWMFLLSPWFISIWKNRIVNVHPALLPKHPGAHAHELVLAAGDKESGMSIHIIDEGVDTGRVLLQKQCAVLPNDTVDTLKSRVQKLECEWFPKVLEMIEQGDIQL